MLARATRQSRVAGALAVSVAALLTTACSRQESYRYGSIKDDAPVHHRASVSSGSSVKLAAVNKPAATSPIETASTAPATRSVTAPAASVAVKEPPPVIAAPVAPVPAPVASLQAPDRGLIARELVAEGQRLFSLGQVKEARKRYFAAMDGMIPEVLLALARSFDGYYISKVPNPDGTEDLVRAKVLYERAVESGSGDAVADLARIKAAKTSPAPTPAVTSAPPGPAKNDDMLTGSEKRE